MEAFFQDALSYLLLYKYAALFLITFLAAFALPLPSTTSLMTAAGFASQGYMNVGLVIFWATLGNVAADNLAYFVARYWGVKVFEKIGIRVGKSPVISFVTERLQEHFRSIIFWSRFEVIMTITVNILNGIARSDYRQFFLYGLLGELVQVTLFVSVGYFFGGGLLATVSFFGEFTLPLIAGTLIVLFLLRRAILRYFLEKRK